VDIRHAPSQGDRQMNAFLYANGLEFILAATKSDKLSRAQCGKMLPVIARDLAVQPWDIIPYSSQTGEGRDKLLARLEQSLKA
jgi:GTP-binding protein